MKRFFLLIVLVMVVSWVVASHRSSHRRPPRPPRYWAAERRVHDGDLRHQIARKASHKAQHALSEARQALAEAGDEVRHAFAEARDEVHQAFDEVRGALVCDEVSSHALPPVPPPPSSASEEVEGVPVPIVPGTRVTRAEAKPPARRGSVVAIRPVVTTQSLQHTVTGRLSATKDRAVADARRQLRDELADWLDPEVPHSWTPPSGVLDALVVGEPRMRSIQKDYGELFEATLVVDTSPRRRTAIVEVYNRQLVERRLATLGAALAFILICLAAVSGYIRADEATKGYYTNRLRMLAAIGVGASGVILYHMMV